jgi:hypothetical protein
MSFALANLPNVSALTTALRTLEKDVGPVGFVILKMDKRGDWVFGANQTEVQPDTLWAVNPASFVHGYIAWGDGEVLGEKMVPLTEPLPDVGPAPAGAEKGWQIQIGMSLKCISGPDKDMETRYTVTSVGGKKAVQQLGVAIAQQIEADQTKPVPVVKLKTDSYKHKMYGKISVPIFDVVEWVGMDGKSDAASAEDAAPAEAEEAPARRRRG